jgi:hypothetical protein
MASTINASTSAGIIQTADTSGVLALQTGGTTAVTVNTTGSVAFGTSASAYGTSGQVLTSAGNAAPSWGSINLGTQVSGTLPVGNGGTGATTLTANNVLLGNGASAPQFVAPGAAGNLLTSNGSTWTSAAAGGGFDAGTAILFYQATAPTGWTKVTTQDNKALRVVSGSGGVAGGSVAFTTAFASQTPSGSVSVSLNSTTATGSVSLSAGGSVSLSGGGSVSATTLTTTQIPSHTHTYEKPNSGNIRGLQTSYTAVSSTTPGTATGAAGGGSSHTHSFTNPTYSLSNPSYSFSGTAHTHTIASSSFTGSAINLAVQYIDVIIATKN